MAIDRNDPQALPFDIPAGPIFDDNDVVPVARQTPPPERRAPAAPGRNEEPRSSRCVVIGPSGAGKTSLLLALDRACTAVKIGEPGLRFVPQPTTARLMERAVQIMVDPDRHHEASREPQRYEFSIYTKRHALHAEIDDGPGGALFPTESLGHPTFEEHFRRWRGEMLERVRAADMLVLCVSCDDPMQVTWEKDTGRLLADAVAPMPVESWIDRWKSRLRLDRNGYRPPAEQCLRARRVLILLTKADRICDDATTQYREAASLAPDDDELRALSRLDPQSVAGMLDPVEQVRHLIGTHVLSLIHGAMRPDAVLAVAACSAGGFDSNGEAYWSEDGKPRAADRERDETLAQWRPWGIRDAVYFLTTGHIRGNVRRLDIPQLAINATEPVKIASEPILPVEQFG